MTKRLNVSDVHGIIAPVARHQIVLIPTQVLTAHVKSPAVVLFSKDEGKFELEAASEGFDASKIGSFVKV